MEEITIQHTAKIIDSKFGDTVFNGEYLGRRVTIHREDYEEVVEKHVTAEHVLRVQAYSGANYTIKDTYACTFSEFLRLKNGDCDIDEIKCTQDEKEALKKTHIYSQSDPKRQSKDAVNLLRDIVLGVAELKPYQLCHGKLNADNIVLCVIEGQVRAKLTHLEEVENPSKNFDYKHIGMLINRMFSNGKSYEAEDLRRHINKQPVLYDDEIGVIERRYWKLYQNDAEQVFKDNPKTIFKHPFFYSEQQSLTFLVNLYALVKKCRSSSDYYQHAHVIIFLNHIQGIHKNEWFSLMNKCVRNELIDRRTNLLAYDRDSVPDLLKFIRHMSSHIDEKSEDFQAEVGEIPDGFFEYFRSRHPSLLLEAQKILMFSFDDVNHVVHSNYQFKDFL